jgi:hypothetical protein
MRYRDRAGATEYLRTLGIRLSDDRLRDLASRGGGPRYASINGRALYLDADLDDWIAEQAARPPVKRGPRKAAA